MGKFSCVAVLLFVCSNAFSQTADTVFGLGSYVNISENSKIGVVVDNKLQLYNYPDGRWQLVDKSDLVLPEKCSSVFYFTRSYEYYKSVELIIGAIADGKIHFYKFDERDGWQLIPELEFSLPNGTISAFGAIYFGYVVGLVSDDPGTDTSIVQFYRFGEEDMWALIPDIDFILPGSYELVFGTFGGIGIIVNNKIQFFDIGEDKTWQLAEEVDFILPGGYESVFYFGNIGVVFNNRVQFYHFDDDTLELNLLPDADFVR